MITEYGTWFEIQGENPPELAHRVAPIISAETWRDWGSDVIELTVSGEEVSIRIGITAEQATFIAAQLLRAAVSHRPI